MRHHGEALRSVSGDDDLVSSVSKDPRSSAVSERQRVLLDFAIKLTQRPQAIEEADIRPLCAHGFSDQAIHDAAAIIAYFNFVNRIASGLGVGLEGELRTR